jgi:hypothetical protein
MLLSIVFWNPEVLPGKTERGNPIWKNGRKAREWKRKQKLFGEAGPRKQNKPTEMVGFFHFLEGQWNSVPTAGKITLANHLASWLAFSRDGQVGLLDSR